LQQVNLLRHISSSVVELIGLALILNKKTPSSFEGEKGKNKNERMMQSIRGLDCLKNIIAWFK
jgi:hypothetical protein